MNKTAAEIAPAPAKPKEKIIFEAQPVLLPTILNLENLILIGFTFVIVVAWVVFHFGLYEFLIIGVLWLLLAVPSFNSIFRAGSTTYVLTNQRVVIFTVGLGQKERTIPLENIQAVKIRHSGLQRFYSAGDIHIQQKNLRGTVKLLGLMKCRDRAEQIQQAAKKAQGKA